MNKGEKNSFWQAEELFAIKLPVDEWNSVGPIEVIENLQREMHLDNIHPSCADWAWARCKMNLQLSLREFEKELSGLAEQANLAIKHRNVQP